MNKLYKSLIDTQNFFLLAGPCVVENRELLDIVAEKLIESCKNLNIPFVFKASFKKANRSRLDSFTGIGDEKALKYLKEVKEKYQIPIITDVHSVSDCEKVKEIADIIQIPAFLCRQTDLLIAAAQTNKIVNIKKGQFLSAQSMEFAVNKIKKFNSQHLVTERGNTFGYQDLIVDFRNIPIINKFSYAVLDATHSLQQPNQLSGITGGLTPFIETIALSGIASGAKGLFIETHPDPKSAKSDGANMLPLEQVDSLLKKLIKVKKSIS